MTIFDTFSYGFDLPAGVQLNRLNKKLFFWETTQNHIEERKLMRETLTKNILKKESQKEGKMLKAFAEREKLVKTEREKKNDRRRERIDKYNSKIAEVEGDTWRNVKQYYREVEQFDLDKKEREKLIMDRLAAYYNAASGQKAEEIRKRA